MTSLDAQSARYDVIMQTVIRSTRVLISIAVICGAVVLVVGLAESLYVAVITADTGAQITTGSRRVTSDVTSTAAAAAMPSSERCNCVVESDRKHVVMTSPHRTTDKAENADYNDDTFRRIYMEAVASGGRPEVEIMGELGDVTLVDFIGGFAETNV